MRLLRDTDLVNLSPAPLRVALRDYLANDHAGRVVAPPRQVVDLSPGAIVFTTGGDAHAVGFRAYETLPVPDGSPRDQVVACWDRETANLLGVALGARLGQLRTGTLGGVALRALRSGCGPLRVGVIGCGAQAETQFWAAAGAIPIADVAVHSRTPDRRAAFAERMGGMIGCEVAAAETAEEAARDRDVVILATTARRPVIDAAWVAPGAHVTTVGPKRKDGHELPLELATQAEVIVSDSPQQIRAAGEMHMLSGHPAFGRIEHLGAYARKEGVAPDGVSLFLSAGLAGSEVVCHKVILEAEPYRGAEL